ncbi:MAG: extracellular solute-binding protein [Chloroflexi bacterium]|nr:extracellular solute-binding protein [Chloroflexota bacterium]
MKAFYKLVLPASLLILVLILAACGQTATPEPPPPPATAPPATTAPEATVPAEQPAEPVSISYWHTMSDPETAQLEKVVAAFEAANPGITVKTTRFAYNDFKSALLTGLAGGAAPDTARMDIAWVPEFADQEALMQLDGAMPGFKDIIANVFPGPLSTNFWQGPLLRPAPEHQHPGAAVE